MGDDDIEQEARIIGWKALESYDWARPLENFLRVHVRNRLINFKRDHFRKLEPPCTTCPHNDVRGRTENGCLKYQDKTNCDKWVKYVRRAESKNNLMNPLPIIESIDHAREDFSVENEDFVERIKAELCIEYRADFLKLMAGVKLPKHRLDILYEEIRMILRG
jgi:DNA-directed RNA polymerase specialized sigma24 family protein